MGALNVDVLDEKKSVKHSLDLYISKIMIRLKGESP